MREYTTFYKWEAMTFEDIAFTMREKDEIPPYNYDWEEFKFIEYIVVFDIHRKNPFENYLTMKFFEKGDTIYCNSTIDTIEGNADTCASIEIDLAAEERVDYPDNPIALVGQEIFINYCENNFRLEECWHSEVLLKYILFIMKKMTGIETLDAIHVCV